jgi:hypothetical protein
MRFTFITLAAVALAVAKPYAATGRISSDVPSASADAPVSTVVRTSSTANGVIDFTPLPSADAPSGMLAGATALTPAGDPTRCATVKHTDGAAELVLVGCERTTAQAFRFTRGEMRTTADLCVTAPGQRDNSVRPVTLEPCDGSQAQQWSATSGGEYRGYLGKCLTTVGPQRRAGTPVAVRGCMPRADQRWAQRPVIARRVRVDSIRLNAVALSLAAGSSSKLNATALDADGREIGDGFVTWASSDPSVATVTDGGVITAVNGGTTTLIAMSDGRVKAVSVEVRGAGYNGLDSGTPTWGAEQVGVTERR